MKKRTIIGGNNVAINKALRFKLLLLTWSPLLTQLWTRYSTYEGSKWGWINFMDKLHFVEGQINKELIALGVLYASIVFAFYNTMKYLKWRVGDIVKVSEPFRNTFKKQVNVEKDIVAELIENLTARKKRVLAQGSVWTRAMAMSALTDAKKQIEGLRELIEIKYNDKMLVLLNELGEF